MYYQLKYGKNYIIKILILVMAAVASEFIIWWGMIRGESADWITSQLVHNPWPYAITQTDNGQTIVSNVVIGFEVTLPAGWQAEETKDPAFYLFDNGEIKCKIVSEIHNYEKEVIVSEWRKNFSEFRETYINGRLGLVREEAIGDDNYDYEFLMPVGKSLVTYKMIYLTANRNICKTGFDSIRKSWLYYYP